MARILARLKLAFPRVFIFLRQRSTPRTNMNIDRGFVNIMILSWGFMLVFCAFQTMGNIEKTVLESIQADDKNFTGDAYTSLAIIYAVFALSNWLAPSYISLTGPRISILTGGACYCLFIASFLAPNTAFLYAASAILGVGAALIWTGHGQYLTENSESETMSRNSGIFWAIFQMSLFVGNLFVYFKFTDETIDADTRSLVFKVLTAVALVGMVLLATMRRPPQRLALGELEGGSSSDKELRIPEPAREKPLLAAWNVLKDAFALLLTPRMLLLSLTFVYTGLVLTFYSGVYSSCIGFTKGMGEKRKGLVGLSGIFIGLGEVFGGAVFGILGSKTTGRFGRTPVVIVGLILHLAAFVTIFLNLPNAAPFTNTDDLGFIAPSPILAMFGSLVLGLGDACYNTQIYSLLGVLYARASAPAFALFKFCQSVAAAAGFFYSSHVGLYVQLGILLVAIIVGTIAFCVVERRTRVQSEEVPGADPTLVDAVSVSE